MRGRLVTILLTATVMAPLAFYAGGVAGFGNGFNAALFMEGSSTASLTVFELRKLREGDVKPVVDMLELQLDSLIVQHRFGRSGYESLFNLPRLAGVGNMPGPDKGARGVLKYRTEFPSAMPPPGKAELDAALADLARQAAGKD